MWAPSFFFEEPTPAPSSTTLTEGATGQVEAAVGTKKRRGAAPEEKGSVAEPAQKRRRVPKATEREDGGNKANKNNEEQEEEEDAEEDNEEEDKGEEEDEQEDKKAAAPAPMRRSSPKAQEGEDGGKEGNKDNAEEAAKDEDAGEDEQEAEGEALAEAADAVPTYTPGPTCCKCRTLVDPLQARLIGKKQGVWQCKVCSSKYTMLYKRFGGWPPAAFREISDEEKVSFWQEASKMESGAALETLVLNTLSSRVVTERSAGSSGKYLPLGAYEKMGFDAALIAERCQDMR